MAGERVPHFAFDGSLRFKQYICAFFALSHAVDTVAGLLKDLTGERRFVKQDGAGREQVDPLRGAPVLADDYPHGGVTLELPPDGFIPLFPVKGEIRELLFA